MRSSTCNEFIVHFLFRYPQQEPFDDASYFCESLCDSAVLKNQQISLYFSNVHLYLLQCSSGKDVRRVTVSGPWWWETRKKAAVSSCRRRCCQTPAAEPRTSVWSRLIYFWLLVLLYDVCVWIQEYAVLRFLWTLSNFCSSTRETNPPAVKPPLKPSHTCCHLHLCESKEQSKAVLTL